MRPILVLLLSVCLACSGTLPSGAGITITPSPAGDDVFGVGDRVGVRVTITNTRDTTVTIRSYTVRLIAPLGVGVEYDTNQLLSERLALEPAEAVPPTQDIHLEYNLVVTDHMGVRSGTYRLIFLIPDLELELPVSFVIRDSR